jgi:cytochrome c553
MNRNLLAAFALMPLVFVAAAPAGAADVDPGQRLSQPCVACHGPDGNSPQPDFPKLAGQHPDYLVKALKDYKSGARKSPIMAPMVANLSPRDIQELADWYSKQKGLVTPPH